MKYFSKTMINFMVQINLPQVFIIHYELVKVGTFTACGKRLLGERATFLTRGKVIWHNKKRASLDKTAASNFMNNIDS